MVIYVEVECYLKSWFNKGKDGDDFVIYIFLVSDFYYIVVNVDFIVEGIIKVVDVEVVNGDVIFKNIGEWVEVELVNGDIVFENVRGCLEVEIVNGEIEVLYLGNMLVSFVLVNGKFDIIFDSLDVLVEIVNGWIDVFF